MPDDDFWTLPSYLRIAPGEAKFDVWPAGDIRLDLAEDGRVLGVTCTDGPVGAAVLRDALAGIRVQVGGDDAA